MTIIIPEQLSAIKYSFQKGVFATSLFLALIMGTPAEAKSNETIQLSNSGRVSLDDTVKIKQLVKEFEDMVGASIPKQYRKYVAESIENLDDVRKFKIREYLEIEKKSERYPDWDIYALLLAENLRNRDRVLKGLKRETPVYDCLLEKYWDDEYWGKYWSYDASCSGLISNVADSIKSDEEWEEYKSGNKK